MSESFATITCPTCWEAFEIPAPAPSEVPTLWDYDCEVCCRPLLIEFSLDEDGEVFGDARSIED